MDVTPFVKAVRAYFAYASRMPNKIDWFTTVPEVFGQLETWYELALDQKIMIFLKLLLAVALFGEDSPKILEMGMHYLIQAEGTGDLENNLDLLAQEIYTQLGKENV